MMIREGSRVFKQYQQTSGSVEIRKGSVRCTPLNCNSSLRRPFLYIDPEVDEILLWPVCITIHAIETIRHL